MLSKENIIKNINTKVLGRNVEYMYETDSTNEQIKRMASEGMDGLLVVADAQNKGKGRLGRNWDSPHGDNIYMSFLIKENISPAKAPMITIIAAMAVLEAVKKYIDEVYIKWPNDIVVNGKKICGILTEMKTKSEVTEYVVVGIGINVNTKSFAEDIKDKATSLYIETGKIADRAEITGRVMNAFEKYFEIFMREGSLRLLVDEYNNNLININRRVEVQENGSKYTATALGIDENGELLIRPDGDENVKKVMSGEVSVRGVYGYV